MDTDLLTDSGENNDGTVSFDDSDRFDEMSLCSWISDQEILCGNWRGWKKSLSSGGLAGDNNIPVKNSQPNVETLIEMCSKLVAVTVPFETVEKMYPNLPEQLQLRIAFWSFPRSDDNIRLYSCLANGSAEEFQKGEQLYRSKAVSEPLQIGFHLSGQVVPPSHSIMAASTSYELAQFFKPAVVFDRGHVTSCLCTCPSAAWCSHVVALCLHRIHQPHTVALRPPVSESLSRLQRNQLQKFSQYLISELPQQLLPYAQQLLDQLLESNDSSINALPGAPDPTAGPSAEDKTQWWMDEKVLRDNVKKMLSKFCGPGPFVLEEVYNLQFASTAPPTAAEWSNLLRPLTGREPEGMWNLLSIVRELFKHRDPNAVELLTLLTQECLSLEQIVVWWFCSRSQISGRGHSYFANNNSNYRNNINTASTEMTKHACASFCDELVVLWRLACLDPSLTSSERQNLKGKLEEWHQKTIERARNARFLGERVHSFGRAVEHFPGFRMAIEACSLDWSSFKLEARSAERAATELPPCPTTSGIAKKTRNSSQSSNDSVESVDNVANGVEPEPVSTDEKVPLHIEEMDEDINILCARAEALQVHGYPEASQAAASVAQRILAENNVGIKESRENITITEEANFFIQTSLVRAAFLCGVLSQDPTQHHLAFKIGIFGLQVPRQPAKSKALEVQLANQETELVALLKRLPLGGRELDVVRERAELFCQGKLERGKAVLPIKLAIFLFQVLVQNCDQSDEDKELGFKAALSVLKMKVDVLEVEYPMLCEGTRRQRGELAVALLDYAKDNPVYLQQVKECLLDRQRYHLEKNADGKRKKNNVKKKGRARDKGKKQGGFGIPDRTQASNGEDDVPHAIPESKPSKSKESSAPDTLNLSTSKTDSSDSRQSSVSSCLSDESSPRNEFRVVLGADSGRDSDSDARASSKALNLGIVTVGLSSRENCSEGEVAGWGNHSPGEDWDTELNEEHRSVQRRDSSGGESNTGSLGIHGGRRVSGGDKSVDVDGNDNDMPQDVGANDKRVRFDKSKDGGRGNREKKVKKGQKNKSRSHKDNRSLEAEAHFTFELAKKVLLLAGGATPSPSIFGQSENSNNVTPSVCNRSLQLCAFELGLFALGLHNATCLNWLSRTYSAHVSWISAQAFELGSVALTIILEQWEGLLTPSEVASIADRASKSNDPNTVQKAAQLALSCLHMAHTLNPGHILRALTQCKEQNIELLEQACLAIESAARGGGVYPEVLFDVAKDWEFLYEQTNSEESNEEQGNAPRRVANEPRASQEPLVPHNSRVPHEQRATDEPRGRSGSGSHAHPQSVVVRMSRLGLGTPHISGMSYGYRGNGDYAVFVPIPTPEQIVQQQVSQQVQHLVESYQSSGAWGQPQVAYQLASAYRVGMLALETLGRRTPDDQPNSMFSKNPPYSANVHWLCSIANKVGMSSLQQFCRTSVNAIHSPFVLHELALEAAGLMAKSNPTQIAFHLRSPSLSPLVQKCLMKYGQCVQHNLTNLPKSEYPEFVELIMHARGAYCMAPGGMTQFNDLLQSIRRSTSKKKDLWQRITTGLAQYQK